MEKVNNNIDSIIKTLQGYFRNRGEIEVAYIFGSVALNESNSLSDIDLAVILNEEKINAGLYPYGHKAHLLSDLMQLLKTNRVDLVILNDAPPLLKHRVLYFGKLICANDEARRIRFQVDTINEYNDFKYLSRPHLERTSK